MKRRKNQEIIKDILRAISCNGNIARTTFLIHKANLSGCSFKIHLVFLKNNRLVEEKMVRRKKYFSITEKGLKWISTST